MGNNTTKVRVQIFGELCLESDNGILHENDLSSAKLTKLLGYILIFRDKVVSHQSLIDIFWEDESKNPAGVLKNLIYRLRTALRVLGNDEFIRSVRGGYQWNPAVGVSTDYEDFHNETSRIWEESDQEKREQMCLKAIECYSGNFSPALAGEFWMVAKISQYQSLYMDVLKALCEIYEAQGRWAEMESVCGKAMAEDFYVEDFHCWMIKSLREQSKYGLAQNHYKKVKKMYQENLGIQDVERIRRVFEGESYELSKNGKLEADFSSLIRELNEKKGPEGAFYCEYPVFRQIYREERRRLERRGGADCMVLFTLRKRKAYGESLEDSGLFASVKTLENVVKECVRIGDIYTRYNTCQYIMLFLDCSCADGEKVASRIAEKFTNRSWDDCKFEVAYRIETVSGISE